MILSDEILEKFKAELSNMPSWKDLAGSQFVLHLAIFIQWAIEDAAFKTERARHEAFIDTALNRSSILAHGEGMEFLPRKAVPAEGVALFSNQGDYPVSIIRETEFMADSQAVLTLVDTVRIPAGKTTTARISQRELKILEFEIEEEKPFYEILLGRDISPKIVSLKIFVAEDKEEFIEWKYDRLLANAYPDSLVFDEFYHFTDQVGIRFGNGDFGKIPAPGAKIRIEATLSEGDFTLLEKQSLWPLTDLRDDRSEPANLEITVAETVQNGKNQEDTEEMRRDLHYAPVYNERLIWDNDYKFFLRRRYPDIVFAVAWGEEESEKMWGYNLEHINRIWICAYSPERNIKDKALEALRDVPMLCRNFVWHDPEHLSFTVRVTGRILKDQLIGEAIQAIKTELTKYYGRDSRDRRDIVHTHEVYQAIYSTGYFEKESGAWFEVSLAGKFRADYIYQMISVDLDKSVIDLDYLDE